jgi:hypothetical protein
MVEGLGELLHDFADPGIGWVLRVGAPVATIPPLAAELGASVAVTDQDLLRLGRLLRAAVTAELRVLLLAVDPDTVDPSPSSPRGVGRPRLPPQALARD